MRPATLTLVAIPIERRKAFGGRVKRARDALGWSQTRLAEGLSAYLLDAGLERTASSVTQGAVTQWERGVTLPRRERIHPLEVVLGLPPRTLSDILDGGVIAVGRGSGKTAAAVGRLSSDRAESGIDVPEDFTDEERARIQGYIDAMAANRESQP